MPLQNVAKNVRRALTTVAALAVMATVAPAQEVVRADSGQAVQPTAMVTQPAAAQPTVVQPAAQPVYYTQAQPVAYGDPYGFLNWLNATRAQYGLAAVGYDPNLAAWASQNNAHQNSRGIGHFVMGPARRQNSAMGSYASVPGMWMASPAHRAALLDPTIRFIGIAGAGAYWTYNAY